MPRGTGDWTTGAPRPLSVLSVELEQEVPPWRPSSPLCSVGRAGAEEEALPRLSVPPVTLR